MVNSKDFIPLCESMRIERHDSVDVHLGYAEPDDESHTIKDIAQWRLRRLQNVMMIAR